MSRRKNKNTTIPYSHNPNIHVYYEYQFGKDTIVPGTKLRFKNIRGEYKFIKYVENEELDVQWFDCMSVKSGEYKSFYADKLKKIIKPRRVRKKQVVN